MLGKSGRLNISLGLAALSVLAMSLLPAPRATAKPPLSGTVLCTYLTFPSGDVACTYSSGPGSEEVGWVITISDVVVSKSQSLTSGTFNVLGQDTFGLTYYNGAMGYNVGGFSPAGLLVDPGITFSVSGASTRVNASTEVILGTMTQTGATNTLKDIAPGAGFFVCPLGLTGCGFNTPPYGHTNTVAGTLEVSGKGTVGGVYNLLGNGTVTTTELVTDNGGTFNQSLGNVHIYPQTTATQNSFGGLYVGYQTKGFYNLVGGTLQMWNVNAQNQSTSANEYIGYLAGSTGTLTQSGGYNLLTPVNSAGAATGGVPSMLYVGYSGTGNYVQKGGVLADAYYTDEYIGYNHGSVGSFVQSAGDNGVTFSKGVATTMPAINTMYIGYRGTGAYTLGATGGTTTGAQLSAYYEYVGTDAYIPNGSTAQNGVGTFKQLSGTNSPASGLYVGFDQIPGFNSSFIKSNGVPVTPQGVYTLSGGALNASGEYVGWATYGTFQQTGGTNTVDSLELGVGTASGSTGQYGYGAYTLSGTGKLVATSAELLGLGKTGIGVFTQSGGTNDGQIVVGDGGTGTYTEKGASAQISGDSETVGQTSTGTFNQLQGNNTMFYTPPGSSTGTWQSLTVGSSSGTGTYNLGCGSGSAATCTAVSRTTLSAGYEQIGLSGTTGRGTVSQWGNTSNTVHQTLYVGEEGTGTYNLYGASSGSSAALLNALAEQVGGGPKGEGTGAFNQFGGKNTVSGALTIAQGTSFTPGAYNLTGGVLTAGSLQVNTLGTYAQTGATTSATITGSAVNDGTIKLNAATLTVDGSYTQGSAGNLILLNGGKIDPTSVAIEGGSFGGAGTIVGNTTVTGSSAVQVGATTGGSLALEGNYKESSGTVTFDIAKNGSGFSVSALVLNPGSSVSIDGSKVVFDFLTGANPLTFFDSGKFVANSFLQLSSGVAFSSKYNLAQTLSGDTYSLVSASYDVTSFAYNPVTGATTLTETGAGSGANWGSGSRERTFASRKASGVPEPGTLGMLALGVAALGMRLRLRPPRAFNLPRETGACDRMSGFPA